jgi:hypothetical protein
MWDLKRKYFLYTRILENNLTAVNQILNTGLDVNSPIDGDGGTALHTACYMGNNEMCELLLSRGADINKENEEGKTPLYSAIREHNTDTVDFLLKHGAIIYNSWYELPYDATCDALYDAIDVNDFECVRLLLNNGATIYSDAFFLAADCDKMTNLLFEYL